MWKNIFKNGSSVAGDVMAFIQMTTASPAMWAGAGESFGDMMTLLVGPVVMSDSADNLYLYWLEIPPHIM